MIQDLNFIDLKARFTEEHMGAMFDFLETEKSDTLSQSFVAVYGPFFKN